jgi:hypothetical protein
MVSSKPDLNPYFLATHFELLFFVTFFAIKLFY